MLYVSNLLQAGRPGTVVNSREEFLELRRRQDHLKCLTQVRTLTQLAEEAEDEEMKKVYEKGADEAKRKLTAFIYGGIPDEKGNFIGCKRRNQFLVMDIDKVPEDTMWVLKARILELKDECKIVFAERSPRCRGCHIAIEGNPNLSVEENLQWVTDKIGIEGVEYDKAVKDAGRLIFATSNEEEDLWILEDKLFEESREVVYADNTEPKATMHKAVVNEAPSSNCGAYPTEFKGIPYTSIVYELEELCGGEPEVGNRNNTYFQMACNIRHICDFKADWIYAILPDYGLSSGERMDTIKSAISQLREYRFPPILDKAIKYAQSEEEEDYDCPPKMPEKLPSLIELLVSRTPEIYKPTVAQAVFPALATHLFNVRFKYIDNQYHEATLMNVLMAETGAGKSCIKAPIEFIMADIMESDKIYRETEEAWKAAQRQRGGNKDKDNRPVCPYQIVSPNMTDAAFRDRLSQAGGKFLYTIIPEIESFQGIGKDKIPFFTVVKNAFDNEYYSAERKSIESSSEMVKIHWNWNASTTPKVGKAFFKQNLTDGAMTRINFCTIPTQPIGSKKPVYGIYDDQFKNDLKPYIDRLNAQSGQYINDDIKNFAEQLEDEMHKIAVERDDRTYEVISYRALVIAFLKANVLCIAEGKTFSQEMKDFIRWSFHYDMWCKMHFFGDDARKELGYEDKPKDKPKAKGGRECELNLLNDEFTVDDWVKIKGDKNKARSDIRQWKCRRKIVPVEGKTDTYRKVS